MAPYHIRKYQENDRKQVIDLFSMAKAEHIPATFCHILKLPQTIVLLLGGPLAVILVSGSWVLAFLASLALLAALRFLAKYPWKQYVAMSLHTDMSDITKSYLSEHGSGFWVAESKGQVVGMVGALPVKQPTLQKEQLELLHLCVAPEHRGQGTRPGLWRSGPDHQHAAALCPGPLPAPWLPEDEPVFLTQKMEVNFFLCNSIYLLPPLCSGLSGAGAGRGPVICFLAD